MKEGHDYYYQVQGQLHITQRKFCLFVVYAGGNISVQQIERNDAFWEKMVGHLKVFYLHCLMPEIVDPHQSRGLQLRDHKKSDRHQSTSLHGRAVGIAVDGENDKQCPVKRQKTVGILHPPLSDTSE